MKNHIIKISFIELNAKPHTVKNSCILVLITCMDILKRMVELVIYHQNLSMKNIKKCLKISNILFNKKVIFQMFIIMAP